MNSKRMILMSLSLLGMTFVGCFAVFATSDEVENKENMQLLNGHPNMDAIKKFMALEKPESHDVLRDYYEQSIARNIEKKALSLAWRSSFDDAVLFTVIDCFFGDSLNKFAAERALSLIFNYSDQIRLSVLETHLNEYVETPLVYAFKEYGDHPRFLEFLERMIDFGVSIDVRAANGDTLLDLCFKGYCTNVEIKQYLAWNLTVLVSAKKGGRRGK